MKSQSADNRIVTLDFEASGINENSYPIEVGVSLADGSTWCALIKPLPNWQHWDKEAEDIHGITREQLARHGKEVQQVAAHLNHILRSTRVYSDCSVLDQAWLSKLYEQSGMQPKFKLVDMMYIMNEENYNRLLATKKIIAKKLNLPRHRASNDALILQMAYHELR